MMLRCWNENPSERPTFKEIYEFCKYCLDYSLQQLELASLCSGKSSVWMAFLNGFFRLGHPH